MADIFSKETRSYIMSRVKGKNTKPEMIIRKFLHFNGFRFRLYVISLFGKPDIVLKKIKTVIFINGCFWHGHKCPAGKLPSSRLEYWVPKISATIKRDLKNQRKLKVNGWKVINIWECQLKRQKLNATLNNILLKLGNSNNFSPK